MRLMRFRFTDGSYKDCELKGFSTLPKDFNQSLSLQETKDGKFWLTLSESLIDTDKRIESIDLR